MEFWGVEVKSGEPLAVKPGKGMVVHLSQACLGQVKKDKGNDSVCLFMNVDGRNLVLGTLSTEKLPQQMFDLVFDKDFELKHNWKNGSVFFYGYRAQNPFNESEEGEFESDSEDELPTLPVANNRILATQAKQDKPLTAEKAKQKVIFQVPTKDSESENDDDTSDEVDAMSEDDEDSKGESDDDDDSDEEDEEITKKVESSKKRVKQPALKTPAPDKKAKIITPQKTDGKKGSSGHVDTPHPSKKAGKTPTNKSNQQTPKSDGSHSCKSCNRSFKSDSALDSHNKAKHGAGK